MSGTPDLPPLSAVLAKIFRRPVEPEGVVELAGDASTRRYFRILLPADCAPRSVVLMRYPDAVQPGDELPFLNVRRYLDRAGVPVPAVLAHDPDARALYLEDLGDTMLEDRVAADGVEACAPLYERCVDILVRLQSDGTRALDGQAIPSTLAFDVGKFAWEIDFFFEHAVRGYGAIPLAEAEERAIGDLLRPHLERLAALPRVLAHRDYHSRNVMVREGDRLSIIDFQDARMGNVYYDIASLLRDAYVTLPDPVEAELVYAWRHGAPADLRRAAGGDAGAFAFLLDLSALQRNVKAIGTFGNQAHVRGKRLYLRYIAPTVAHIERNFDRNPELKALAARLRPLLSALSEKAASEAAK
jgi:aminoglycoside/choline kinase family phosphotransferase